MNVARKGRTVVCGKLAHTTRKPVKSDIGAVDVRASHTVQAIVYTARYRRAVGAFVRELNRLALSFCRVDDGGPTQAFHVWGNAAALDLAITHREVIDWHPVLHSKPHAASAVGAGELLDRHKRVIHAERSAFATSVSLGEALPGGREKGEHVWEIAPEHAGAFAALCAARGIKARFAPELSQGDGLIPFVIVATGEEMAGLRLWAE
jgi:hypothetical protein